jgi:sulfur carrier protein
MSEGCSESRQMNLVVNGERFEATDQVSVRALIDTLQLSEKRVAVELNGAVVRRAEWDAMRLSEGDKVEIVHFVGGG